MKQEPIFTPRTDWFTVHQSNWEQWFAPYAGKPYLEFLEVGCFEGRSALWLLAHVLTDPTSHLTCIDPFAHDFILKGKPTSAQSVEAHFLANIAASGQKEQVTILRGYSQDAMRTLPKAHYDAVYIDGSHLAADVLADAVAAYYVAKPGALLAFDDYQSKQGRKQHERPHMALDAFLAAYSEKVTVLAKAYQLALRKGVSGDT